MSGSDVLFCHSAYNLWFAVIAFNKCKINRILSSPFSTYPIQRFCRFAFGMVLLFRWWFYLFSAVFNVNLNRSFSLCSPLLQKKKSIKSNGSEQTTCLNDTLKIGKCGVKRVLISALFSLFYDRILLTELW